MRTFYQNLVEAAIRSKFMAAFLTMLLVMFKSSFAETGSQPYPEAVMFALDTAGYNRGQLEKVLAHYAADRDSLKFQAAVFLISNMEGHCYQTFAVFDTAKKEIPFDPLQLADLRAVEIEWDSLGARYGKIDFDRRNRFYDLNTITADFLIGQIDYAFNAWRQKPWARGLSFDQFCQYVLPYRGSNEPLESWRLIFWDRYQGLESKMRNPSDPVEAARLINNDVKSWYAFDPRYYYHPTDEGLREMLTERKGRCEDMTNLAIYAMRANGLAVTSDYTPFWANSGNNHAWNAIVTPEGKVIPFMGAEANPGEYSLWNKLAKVYRKTYSKQLNNLAFQKKKQEKVPGWLSGKSYLDVTRDYVDVCNVPVAFKKQIPDSVDIAYLCVFNSGEWQAIQWGRIVNDTAVFSDIGRDIAYLPALYINEKIEPFGPPFILGKDCSFQKLVPDEPANISVQLISTTQRKQEISTDGIEKTFLTLGQEYELFYWADGWQLLGKSVASDKPLVFDNVPSGRLYWLVASNSDREERIFTLEDGKQIWW